jgi:hypothetical protein
VSDFLDPPEVNPDSQARRRALWGLGILACVAVIIVSLMLLLGGSGGGGKNNANPNDPFSAPPTTSARSTPSSTASPTNSGPTGSTTPTTSAARTGNPCSGASSCAVDGDGGVLAALNQYRTRHGRPAVPGTVTPDAQTCALHQGNGPTCQPHYIWTVASAQNGPQAVGKLTGFGSSWLLDGKVSSFAVGWAYAGGSYQCVVLKTLAGE